MIKSNQIEKLFFNIFIYILFKNILQKNIKNLFFNKNFKLYKLNKFY